MTPSELRQVAADMRRELPLVGRCERILSGRGRAKIYLRMQARYDRVSLAIGHRDAYPDAEEAGQIAGIFGAAGDPLCEQMIIATQDGQYLRVPCLVYGWFESRN